MLRRMRLENFRAFREVELELSPLTVLLGANSTGKSSILQALILLKQSLRGPSLHLPLTFSGPLIDLGRLRDVGWQGKEQLLFRLEWSGGRGLEFRVAVPPEAGLSTESESFRFQFNEDWYELQEADKVVPRYFSFEFSYSSAGPSRSPEEEKRELALREVNAAVTDFFARLRYIGPLRESFREVPFSGEEPESVGPDARYLIPFLKLRPDVTERIGWWLREHGLAAGLEIRETARGSGRWAAYVLEEEDLRVNLADTGFGYSQLIPVLAELYGAPDSSLILIEQPELHLNPRLAVWMGDVLLSAVNEGKAVLAETHSEHIVLRLRRRVAEGVLSGDHLALYFAHRSLKEGQSYLNRITLDDAGQPSEKWPEDFWGEDYDEAFHLAKAALRRRQEKRL